jgi:hypothetical protein
LNDRQKVLYGIILFLNLTLGGYQCPYYTIQELTSVIPPNVFPTPNSIKQIWKELYRLHRKDLLEWHGTWRETESARFSITGNGTLFIREYLHGIGVVLKDEKKYEKFLNETEGDSATKTYLKGLREKLVGKSQEEIVNGFFLAAKLYTPTAITLLLRLIVENIDKVS